MSDVHGRLVVLGATGFVGSHVVDKARLAGWDVVAVSSRDIDLAASTGGLQLAAILQDGDTIVHSAAVVPSRNAAEVSRNLLMTQALVDATADVLVEQLVVISTDAVYGSGSGVFSEQSACAPDSIYGAMALAREMICASVETPVQTIVRPVAVYGAGDTHNSYGPNRFARQALSSGEIGLLGAGEATRDHVTVQDVAEVIIRVVAGRQAGTVNVASGQSISFADLAVLVGSADGMSANVVSAGTELAPTFKTYDTSTLLRWFPDFMPTVAAMGVPRMVATMRESETG